MTVEVPVALVIRVFLFVLFCFGRPIAGTRLIWLTARIRPCFKAHRFEEAIPLLQRLCVLKRRYFGEEHIEHANSVEDLAQAYQHTGAMKEAEAAYLHSVRLTLAITGPNHLDYCCRM